jgi:poly(A) polymerase
VSAGVTLAGRAPWLADNRVQAVLACLSRDGEEARVAGGAVRNALMGLDVADIDIATTTVPEETVRRGREAGFKVVETGIDHGTVTILAAGRPIEVTTLRADIETDGRHAVVLFGRDWRQDAERRDFTMNGLYVLADGTVIDLVGGVADIEKRLVRFIGEAETRIREDYLRILRFFRFFAWYGTGRPDAEGLRACARLKDGIARLSAERQWAEIKKLLAAPDPSRALLWMRQAGVLTSVLPETEKWGIDAIHGLVRTEQALSWEADPMLRLASIVPPDASRLAELSARLRLSKVEAARLAAFANARPLAHGATEAALDRQLYRSDLGGTVDRLRLALSSARMRAENDDAAMIEAGGYSRLLARALAWKRPTFPVKAADLKEKGFEAGPALGAELRRLEDAWVESSFLLERDELLSRVTAPEASD